MRNHQELAAIARSLEKQYKALQTEKPLMKSARYFGYVIGFLGNAIVAPYTYQFGQRVSNFIVADDNTFWKACISAYFSIVSTITLGSLGLNVCGEIFPETIQLFYDNPFKEIKVRERKEKLIIMLGLTTTIVLSIISNVAGTYLTDLAYREYSPFLALIFDFANQLAWTTVSAWSFYTLPAQIYKEIRNDLYLELKDSKNIRFNLRLKCDNLLKNLTSFTEEEIHQFQKEFFPEDKFTPLSLIRLTQYKANFPVYPRLNNKLRISISLLGMLLGTISIYFYYPVGKASGRMFAEWFNLNQNSIYFETFMGVITYSSQAALAMMTSKSVFGIIYDRIGNLCISNSNKNRPIALQEPLVNQNESHPKPTSIWTKIKTILYIMTILLFALTASSYRAEVTTEYVPNSSVGLFLVIISALGAFCLGSWSLDRLADKLNQFSNFTLQSKLIQKVGLLCYTLDKMDDKHLNALVADMNVDSATSENILDLPVIN